MAANGTQRAITYTSVTVHVPTNNPQDTALLNNIFFPIVASFIGDIAVILIVSIMIVCVVIRFKKRQNIISTTTVPTASVSRSNTNLGRAQAQSLGIH